MKLCIMQSPTNFRLRLFLLSKETEKLQSVIYSLAVLKTIVDNEKDQLLYPHELSWKLFLTTSQEWVNICL